MTSCLDSINILLSLENLFYIYYKTQNFVDLNELPHSDDSDKLETKLQ